MVVTMLEAQLSPSQASGLVAEFQRSTGELPPVIMESFLLREAGGHIWKILTVWNSTEDLRRYRDSVNTPEGVRMFRSVGAEPSLTVFEVLAHASRPHEASNA